MASKKSTTIVHTISGSKKVAFQFFPLLVSDFQGYFCATRAREMGGAHLCALLELNKGQTKVAVKYFEAFSERPCCSVLFTNLAVISN